MKAFFGLPLGALPQLLLVYATFIRPKMRQDLDWINYRRSQSRVFQNLSTLLTDFGKTESYFMVIIFSGFLSDVLRLLCLIFKDKAVLVNCPDFKHEVSAQLTSCSSSYVSNKYLSVR